MKDDELLNNALSRGIINVEELETRIHDMEKQEALKKHKYEIYQNNKGKWLTNFPDKEKGRIRKERNTKEEIEELVYEFYKDAEENPTIDEVFKEWNDRKLSLGKIKTNTHQRNKQMYEKHFDTFGKQRIRCVSVQMLVDFMEEQIPRFNMTSKAFSNLKTIVKGFIKRARRRGLIDFTADDVMAELDTSEYTYKKSKKADDEEVFTDDELPRVMEYLQDNQDIINLGILLMFITGLRVGELVALKWQDVDGYGINVRRSETRYYDGNVGVYEIQEHTKTSAGQRFVAIPTDYYWVLLALKKINPFSDFIFMRDGERLHPYSFRNRLRIVCEKTGCVLKSPHKIRKTYGSILLDNHLDNRLIINQMGHTDILCTENFYHRNRKNNEEKSKIISNIPQFCTKKAE